MSLPGTLILSAALQQSIKNLDSVKQGKVLADVGNRDLPSDHSSDMIITRI